MAEYDNKAFNAMNNASPDMDIGGAIDVSEYEQNMDSSQRKGFEKEVHRLFVDAYNINPLKGRMPFKSFIKNLNSSLINEWAKEGENWDRLDKGMEVRVDKKHPRQVYDNAKKLMKLASLHTGRVEDLSNIANKMSDKPQDDREGGKNFVYPGYWSQGQEDKKTRKMQTFTDEARENAYRRSLLNIQGNLVDPVTREVIEE